MRGREDAGGAAGGRVSGPEPGLPHGLLPLWPFQSQAQVRAWRSAQEATGSDPQHRLDPASTALEFTRGALGFTVVDRVTGITETDLGTLVRVGWATDGGRELTVATLRLVRFGAGSTEPWVVTGTADDATRTVVARPGYGADVDSVLPVGGRITGSDEALRVSVAGPGGRVLGSAGPVAVGGVDEDWGVTVDLAPARSGTLLTLAVWIGGHVGDVEWFAVSGVRHR
jgi:hypothetical protein